LPATSRQGRAYAREEIEELLREALTKGMADGTPFADLSVDRLVSSVGVARSTFYKYFDDKSAMLQVLSAHALKHLYAAQRLWIAKGADVTRDDVRGAMRTLLDFYLEEQAVMRAVAEASVYDTTIGAAYASGVEDYARAMRRFVPADTARALAWMVERTVGQLAPGATPQRLDAIADALADVVWAAVAQPAHPRGSRGTIPAGVRTP
jgi:AcrR family transcriptional regulator